MPSAKNLFILLPLHYMAEDEVTQIILLHILMWALWKSFLN